jgi:starch synthase
MRVLVAASEVVGFAKTGGLADVTGSLPRALARRGIDCRVILPLHGSCRRTGLPEPTPLAFDVPLGDRTVPCRIWSARLPGSDVPAYFLENDDIFGRDQPEFGRGLYQFNSTDGTKRDYPDNGERFAFFCHAVIQAIRALDWWPDVLHCNDWQTGLAPVYLREHFGRHPDPAVAARWNRIRCLYSIHNIAYQGRFAPPLMEKAHLDWRLFNHHQLEFHDSLCFLKAGIVFSDRINTVSPTYAEEIKTPWYGRGMQGVLIERSNRLCGIVNGVDYGDWDPSTDPRIPRRYGPADFEAGKAECKAALAARMGLGGWHGQPLLGMVARLVEQKGLDIMHDAAIGFLGQGARMVVLGEGDPWFRDMLSGLAQSFPGQVGLRFGFDEDTAHIIESGSDMFLMPSLFEPSGLNQLYSLRYGTPPVVRGTGGLADTVTDTNTNTLEEGTATGFVFHAYSSEAFRDAVLRAMALWRHDQAKWGRVVRSGMSQDWSWERSAGEYHRLYADMVAG